MAMMMMMMMMITIIIIIMKFTLEQAMKDQRRGTGIYSSFNPGARW